MEFCKLTLPYESVDEILWRGRSNESSLPVLSLGAMFFSKLYKMKFGNLVEICLWLHLTVKVLIQIIYNEEITKETRGETKYFKENVLFYTDKESNKKRQLIFRIHRSKRLVVTFLGEFYVQWLFLTLDFCHPRQRNLTHRDFP